LFRSKVKSETIALSGSVSGEKKTVMKQLAIHSGNKWVRVTLLALVGFAIRMPALQGEMVWDDAFLVRDNPLIKSPLFIFEVFRHYLWMESAFATHYRPMQNVSFMADYLFWNNNVYGFHLTNVLLHVASGILLYFLLERLFTSFRRDSDNDTRSSAWSFGAFFAALLWTVHPVHSAAVDYISGRADSLAFFFACSGWLLFFRAREASGSVPRYTFYVLAAISGLLALCSRETACIWLVLFILYLIFFQKGIPRRQVLVAVACALCLIGIYAGLRELPSARATPGLSTDWSPPMRAVLMARALGDYARLMIFPANLHMERTVVDPQNYLSNHSWRGSVGTEYLSILGFAFLAALILAASRRGEGRRFRIFGSLWFMLGYLPISNLMELDATVAEHWLYLPIAGFLVFLVGCALDFPVRFRKPIVIFAVCAIAALSVRSAVRSSDWMTERGFYQRTLAANGSSLRVVANLAQVYSNQGQYAKAETVYRKVLEMSPDYPIARNNLAEALARQGKRKEAEEILASTTKAAEQTRKEYPRTWIAVLNLALYRHIAKDDAAALVITEKARRDYPGIWEVIRLESELLRETQGPDAALQIVENFAHDNWWHYGAALALGRLYAEKGDALRAEAALRHASWLDLHDADALRDIALMRLRQNRLDDAFRTQQRAIARQPDEPRQYILLSEILKKMGRDEKARAALAEVSRLRALSGIQTVVN
jgi:tetratricopeptide (TPR) repeat protein